MTAFRYEATTEQGERREGVVEAPGAVEAAYKLQASGLTVARMAREGAAPAPPPADALTAFSFFNRSLGELCAAGVPVDRAVGRVAHALRRGGFRDAVERVEAALKSGRTLQDAVAAEPSFPAEYRWMVQAGAASGSLPAVLAAVAREAEARARLRRSIVRACAYPLAAVAFAFLAATAFAFAFLPTCEMMYRQLHIKPPAHVAVAAFLTRSIAVPSAGAAMIVALLAGAAVWMRRSPDGERLLYRVPLLGPMVRDARVSRMLRALGTLLRAGTPLRDAMPVACLASASPMMRAESAAVCARLGEGATLAAALAESRFVPEAVRNPLAAAERAGRLAESADSVCDFLDDLVLARAEDADAMLRPAALAAAGVVVGSVIVSLVLPYVTLLRTVNG
jgi:type IV pilus assembly protein PilC